MVTGAASGVGAATARVFAEAGADVAAAWFSGDPYDVAATAEGVEAAGRRCHVVDVDVSDTASVERMSTGRSGLLVIRQESFGAN